MHSPNPKQPYLKIYIDWASFNPHVHPNILHAQSISKALLSSPFVISEAWVSSSNNGSVASRLLRRNSFAFSTFSTTEVLLSKSTCGVTTVGTTGDDHVYISSSSSSSCSPSSCSSWRFLYMNRIVPRETTKRKAPPTDIAIQM